VKRQRIGHTLRVELKVSLYTSCLQHARPRLRGSGITFFVGRRVEACLSLLNGMKKIEGIEWQEESGSSNHDAKQSTSSKSAVQQRRIRLDMRSLIFVRMTLEYVESAQA
jgi:hypothetical protein